MIFFQKTRKPVSSAFYNRQLTTQSIKANASASSKTSFLIGTVFLLLNGCSAQQIDKILDKIPNQDGSPYSQGGSPYTQGMTDSQEQGYSNAGQTQTQAVAPKIIYFKADPPFVIDGSSTTLQWRTDDVASAQITGVGAVSVTGNREVTPNKKTTYELVAVNNVGQTVRDRVTIPFAVPMRGELPNNFKIRAIKRFNSLNPKKAIQINPKLLKRIKLNTKYNSVKKFNASKPLIMTPLVSCAAGVQNKIAWNYQGNKKWPQANINRLCKGVEYSPEPGRCFNRVMHGGVNWGGGTKWQWNNAVDLCEGTKSASVTISCFQRNIRNGRTWKQAIRNCN